MNYTPYASHSLTGWMSNINQTLQTLFVLQRKKTLYIAAHQKLLLLKLLFTLKINCWAPLLQANGGGELKGISPLNHYTVSIDLMVEGTWDHLLLSVSLLAW